MKGFLHSVLKSAFGVFTSRILGLIRDISIAAVFGASAITDIFFVAFAIPNLFRALFAEGALSSAFVPILGNKLKEGEDKANGYFTGVLIRLSVFIMVVIVIISLFSGFTVKMFMPGYAGNRELVNLGAKLLVIVMPYLLFVSISALFAGYLNLKGSFYIPYASTALLNFAMILSVFFAYCYNKKIEFLAWGVFVGGILQLFLVFFFAKIHGFKFRSFKEFTQDVSKTFLLIVPSILGVGINQLNFLVGRVIASYLTFGSISFLYYANRLFQFPFGLFSVTIGTVSLTELSKKDDTYRFEIVSKALISIFLIILPSMLGMIVFSDAIIALVFQRKAFTFNDVVQTSYALKMYTIGLIFFSMNMTFTKVFHSILDTKTPVKVSAVLLIANTLFSLIFMKSMAHAGIALGSSISALIGSIIYSFLLKKRNLFDFNGFLINKGKIVWKIVFVNFLFLLFLIFLRRYNLHILIVIPVAMLFYYVILRVAKIDVWRILR